MTRRFAALGLVLTALLPLAAQTPAQDAAALARQRIQELQAEADRLAADSKALLVELRRLELEREIKAQELRRAEADLAAVTTALDAATARAATLEAERIAGTPGVHERLVELYKRGRGGYVRLLLEADDLRAIGRMSRGVAAVASLDMARFEAHRRTLAAERVAVAELVARQTERTTAREETAQAQQALDAAIANYTRRIDELDRRRDLAAQFVGELQTAQQELQRRVSELGGGRSPALPIEPFQGALDWPVAGSIRSRFGRGTAGRFGATIVRNGIEIAARAGDPVRAVHPGVVSYAAPFTGFGTLVIVDHGGGAFSLYGHLADADVAEGAAVRRGATVGRAGRSPEGDDAAYFELRIDGRPVDPVQWLRRSR